MHSLEKALLVVGKVRGAVNREQEAAHKGKWDWTAAKGEEQRWGSAEALGEDYADMLPLLPSPPSLQRPIKRLLFCPNLSKQKNFA